MASAGAVRSLSVEAQERMDPMLGDQSIRRALNDAFDAALYRLRLADPNGTLDLDTITITIEKEAALWPAGVRGLHVFLATKEN